MSLLISDFVISKLPPFLILSEPEHEIILNISIR
jgi:hypothetical protein